MPVFHFVRVYAVPPSCTVPNCYLCVTGQPSVCQACNSGYTVSSASCIPCTVAHCAVCVSGTPSQCQTCSNGWIVNSGGTCDLQQITVPANRGVSVARSVLFPLAFTVGSPSPSLPVSAFSHAFFHFLLPPLDVSTSVSASITLHILSSTTSAVLHELSLANNLAPKPAAVAVNTPSGVLPGQYLGSCFAVYR